MGDLRASDVAQFLNSSLVGKDFCIQGVTALSDLDSYTLTFSKSNVLNLAIPCVVLVPLSFKKSQGNFSYIAVQNPRLAFAKVLTEFFTKKHSGKIDESVCIGENTLISKGVCVGSYSVIGNNVVIGEGTIINSHVVIGDNSIIGKNCYIKSGTIIGEEGFGFDFEEDGTPIRIPHIGNVIIGDEVEVGAKNTIARGTLGSTQIEDCVKIDDQVHIGHNCIIGTKTVITACAEISGSVYIGEKCWIAPNVSIMNKIHIGNNVKIGLGAVVTSNIEDNKKVMGIESIDLRSLLKFKKRVEYGK